MTRSTFRALVATASALAVLALCGVAAGSLQSPSPKQWVSNFCGSVLTWEQTVKSSSAKLKTEISALQKGGRVDLPAAKAKLVGFMGGLVRATNTMIGKIDRLGPPGIKNGSKLQKGVLAAFGQVLKAFRLARTDARKLPTATRKAFAKGANALAAEIQSSTNRIAQAFTSLERYSTGALDAAALTDPACKKLQ